MFNRIGVIFSRVFDFNGAHNFPKSKAQIKKLENSLKKNPEKVKKKNYNVWQAYTIYQRILKKLETEAVEDYRIDFEDGYGNRSDDDEDYHAKFTAQEITKGMKEKTLPPFIGIRIKPFTEELKTRSMKTLNIFISTLLKNSGGTLPDNFVVTLPKVTIPEQVSTLVELFVNLEKKHSLTPGSLKLEIMIETPQSIINEKGISALPILAAAANGRCVAAHFGVYDYTASCNITAAYQGMSHQACDFARHMMKVAFAGTSIMISDGATNIMPVGPYKIAGKKNSLTTAQKKANTEFVHKGWKLAFDDTMHSLQQGFYQGWDLHPAQLPARYAAVYSFFLEGLRASSVRLKTFIEKAAQATLAGDVFDDAATGQGLLNYFLRGINCKAITEKEALATGLTFEEIQSRSFAKILEGRRNKK